MTLIERWKALGRNETVRRVLFVVGCILVLAAPVAGILPGPGGIIVFAVGLGLALKNSLWAKRQYVAFKRRWPNSGRWADWGLRRESAKRREEARKAAEPD